MDIVSENTDIDVKGSNLLLSIKNTLEQHPEETYTLCLRFIASYSSSKSKIPPESIIEIAKGFIIGKSYVELSSEMGLDVNYQTLRNIDNVLKRAFYIISDGSDSPILSEKDKTIAERFRMYPLLLEVIQDPEISSRLEIIPHYRDLLIYIANGYSLYDFINHYSGDTEIPNIVSLVYTYNRHLLNIFGRPNAQNNNRTMHVLAKYVAFRKYSKYKCPWSTEQLVERRMLSGLLKICNLSEKKENSISNMDNGSYIADLMKLIKILPVIEQNISSNELYKNPYKVSGVEVLEEGLEYEGVLPKLFLLVIDRLSNFKTVSEIAEEISESIHYNKDSVALMLYPLIRYIESILTFPPNSGLTFEEILLTNQANVAKEVVVLIREKLREKIA